MRRRLPLFVLLIPTLLSGQEIDRHGLKSITPAEMKAHVDYLASDEMRGRDTPSPELDSCAAYIAREFATAGLMPLDEDAAYYQSFNVVKVRLDEPNTLHTTTPEGTFSHTIRRDFIPITTAKNGKVSAPLVFVGYGISAPELDYDDYENIDASGRIAFMMTGEPRKKNPDSPFSGRDRSEYSRIEYKIQNALDHGAAGLVLVSNPNSRFRRPPNRWPSLLTHTTSDAVPLTLERDPDRSLVCVHIAKALANTLLSQADATLTSMHDAIDADLRPRSFPMPEVVVTMETNLKTERFPTQNVIGLWRGADPRLREEVVIIGAHYDHVGVRHDTLVYNGADDNASGTAGVLEIAEAFTRCATLPKRSILFLAFAAEEKGLYGSRYYTDHPVIPIHRTVAMLNMDMISRNDTLSVDIIGERTSPDLEKFCSRSNEAVGMNLTHTHQHFMQSDHYPFYLKGIPVLLFSSGDTEDLHRPTDDPEKAIPEKMASIARLVFGAAWFLANQPERPNFMKLE